MTETSPRRLAVAFAREAGRISRAGWCSVCVDYLAVSGVGITLMSGERMGPLAVSDPRVAAVEDEQFTLGEGPTHEAFRRRQPVMVPSFDEHSSLRWPTFVDVAVSKGFGAAFAYPLSLDGTQIGVLSIYQNHAGPLTADQQIDTMAVAELLAATVLSTDHVVPGVAASDLELAVAYRAEIYQASGMVAIQLRISADQAMARIRAYAFASGRPVGAVASDIVARRLRLDDDQSHHSEGS